ncbi:MAG: thiol-disulfide oxidoreductase DCC family protein [Planctomycetota bacterium]|jgi:predicted DCC family thiol-disulfide oxidoreductase YuxK
MPPRTHATDAPLLLYDGECGLCSHAVQFILRRDRRRRMLFAPLQSETGREILAAAGLDPSDRTTMILRTGPGAVLVRSDAALTAAADLRGPWRWAAGLRWIPRPLRDAVYRLIARFRHRIFPAPAACLLPDPGDAHRFIG